MGTTTVDRIFSVLDAFGHIHYGEEVTQMQHILQSAHLAVLDKAPAALIAAALLHDVGHFLDDAGNAAEQNGIDAGHETSGAAYLALYFSAAVTDPVQLHVEAKRYLCSAEPNYRAALSHASELSLSLQGGSHTSREMAEFVANPGADNALRLRRYDDLAKRQDWQVPNLESYRVLLQSLVLR